MTGLEYLLAQPDAPVLLQMLGLAGPEFADCPGRATWYRKGRCRCEACRRAWAVYRAEQRGAA